MVEIRLEGPGKNALGTQMMTEVQAQVEAANGAPILITGTGDAFSAGLNLFEVADLDHAGMSAFLVRLEDFIRTLYTYPGPTVAAVNGHAIAGGCILAMACDHRIATTNERARIGLNEVAIGLRFSPALLRFVQNLLSPNQISEAILGAGLHAPVDALRLGLVDALSDDPVAMGRAHLEALAKHPSAAYAATKADLRAEVMTVSAEDQHAFMRDVLPFWTSDVLKDRINAVLKR